MKLYEMETNYFKFHNANPKTKRACDCVIRALALGLNKKWEQVLLQLTEVSLIIKDVPNSKKVLTKYLKNLGFEKQKQPRKQDNTKYTIKEFAEAHIKGVYIVDMANHCTCVINGKIHDTWNCGHKCVSNYWIIK